MKLLCTLVALLFYSFVTISPSAASIDSVCPWLGDQYISYSFCAEILEADPRSRTADDHGLAVIAVNLTIANATKIVSKLHQMSASEHNSTTKELLRGCLGLFSHGIPRLRWAADETAGRNYGGAAPVIKEFLFVPGDCNEKFLYKSGALSPLAKENSELMNVVVLANAIANFLARYYGSPPK